MPFSLKKYLKKFPENRILTLIGNPVQHSLSPIMHNAIIQKMGLNYTYNKIKIKENQLKDIINEIRSTKPPKILGLNVTIPYKQQVLQYLDKIEGLAEKIGAVNTIKNENGFLIGRNTDGEGFYHSLTEIGYNLKDKSVIIIGAGGGALSISFILAKYAKKITIINRSSKNLKKLIKNLEKYCEIPINGILLHDIPEIKKVIFSGNLLINTTPVGMYPNTNKSPIDTELLNKKIFVYDIIYNPINTKLIKEATKKGCKTLSGVNMLVNQGALGFKWWTGLEPDKKLMKKVLLKKLKRN